MSGLEFSRRRTARDGTVQIAIWVPMDLDEQIVRLKQRTGMTKKELIVILLRHALVDCKVVERSEDEADALVLAREG